MPLDFLNRVENGDFATGSNKRDYQSGGGFFASLDRGLRGVGNSINGFIMGVGERLTGRGSRGGGNNVSKPVTYISKYDQEEQSASGGKSSNSGLLLGLGIAALAFMSTSGGPFALLGIIAGIGALIAGVSSDGKNGILGGLFGSKDDASSQVVVENSIAKSQNLVKDNPVPAREKQNDVASVNLTDDDKKVISGAGNPDIVKVFQDELSRVPPPTPKIDGKTGNINEVG
ncbi:MAG: hypothetical protein R3D71_07675 [Rickettsiales bacterium]